MISKIQERFSEIYFYVTMENYFNARFFPSLNQINDLEP